MENLEEQTPEKLNQQILILYIDKLKQENKDLKAKVEELELRIETIKRDKRYGKH